MASAALLDRLDRWLSDPAREALRAAVALAQQRGEPVYLAGGAVRDLLLDAPQLDLDLVVEGDAAALAQALAAALGARAVVHARFGTAVLQGDGFRLDFARARLERYERPGALPAVRPAALLDDLARRDFTVNAMALRLSEPGAGALVDPHGGRADLDARFIRVLHDAGFRDDATRILRALRYAGRLGCSLDPGSEALLRRDLPCFDTISGARLRHEIERIAQEEQVEAIVRRAVELGVLAAVHPALRPAERDLRACGRLAALAPSHRDAALLCLLLARAAPPDTEAAIARLSLTGRQAAAVRGALALRADEARLSDASLRPSEAVALLDGQPALAVEAFALIAARAAAERARRYLEEWRALRPRLTGRDVQA
ncbi:MAG: CCA tRNA nucleotidyltransferase, partial [Chloroflexi bacterium]|nr:CCA tRNA nucleotidyltransferase [Chloroflexota bacterium]